MRSCQYSQAMGLASLRVEDEMEAFVLSLNTGGLICFLHVARNPKRQGTAALQNARAIRRLVPDLLT
jgi:hypothetical protein